MKTDLVDRIVAMEWEMFQDTANEGGRAPCQDDFRSFDIMRRSQWDALPEPVLESCLSDLLAAAAAGRNLVTEKYARIMAYTAPEEYAKIEKYLPAVSCEVYELAHEITAIQTEMDREASLQYPNLMALGRRASQRGAAQGDTAFDAYLEGELQTFSAATLRLYLDYLRHSGMNHVIAVLENIARMRGYASLEEANARVGQKHR